MVTSLGQILPHAAGEYGERVALICGDREFSFAQLDEMTNRVANGLIGVGILPGDRVTLYSPNCWEWIVSYYAVLKAGAVVNPINVMLTPEEVEYVVTDCGAKAVLASKEKGEPILGLKGRASVSEMILFGDDVPAGARSFNQLCAENEAEFEVADTCSDVLSTICYTSGTTGHPKGAMLSHENVIINAAMTAQMHVRTSADTVVTSLPCAHVYGNVVFNSAFLFGLKIVIHERFVEDDILRSIEKHRATMFEGVPTMYLYLLNYPRLDEHDLSSLSRCTVGGQTMPVTKMQEVERRFGCPLVELWGMTELAGLGTTHPLYGRNRHGSIGISLPYAAMRVAAPDDPGRTLAANEVGELMARGPMVMQGYYGNEAATKETIEPDGWLHTGDLARMDEDGYIYIVDRIKDMILTAGFNVYPAELERVISAHPSVAMVAVGPHDDPLKGEVAKAYVVLRHGAAPDPDAITAHCRQHLAAYKVPRAIQFVEDLPKTSTGKVMRRVLKTLDD